MPTAYRRRTITVAAIVVVMLCATGCGGSAAICAKAGGTYAEGTCTRAGQAADQQWCEARGAVYLAGSNTCAYGEGR